MSPVYRQEVLNVLLAQLLQERGIVSAPECILKLKSDALTKRRMPDVLVEFNGLRTMIEGEIDKDANARTRAIASSQRRVEEGLAQIAIAVIYPSNLHKTEKFKILKSKLAKSDLQIAIVTEAETTDFSEGDVNYLKELLQLAVEHLIKEDVVARAVAALDAGIEDFAFAVCNKPGMVGRLAKTLELGEAPTGKGMDESISAPLPQLDLCVMNPPFTRSVGGNLLFGSAPQQERAEMQKELKRLVKPSNVRANITAGLGSVFVATAHQYIKQGGRLALVLPKALLSGVAWEQTRLLLNEYYRVDYIVCSHDPERWNFSESTSLSEVLIVATKTNGKNSPAKDRVIFINLWRNPTTSLESLVIASGIKDKPPDLASGQGAVELATSETKLGEAISVPWSFLKEQSNWMTPAAFAQSELNRLVYHLAEGKLRFPGQKKKYNVPLCPLKNLGDLGPDRRDIHDGFDLSKSVTSFPAFWGHDSKAVYQIAQKHNHCLIPLHKAKEGRNLRKVEDLWPLAAKILIAEKMRFNTQSTVAIRLSQKVLSNVWWPFSLNVKTRAIPKEKTLALWLNSTVSIVSFISIRQETEGAWVNYSKPVLYSLPVLDLNSLSAAQLKKIAAAYDQLAKKPLRPLPEIDDDPVRAQIDQCFADVLNLPDFSPLRAMLAREPVVCLQRL